MAVAGMQTRYKNRILALKTKQDKTKQYPTPWKLKCEYIKVVGYKFNKQKSVFLYQ